MREEHTLVTHVTASHSLTTLLSGGDIQKTKMNTKTQVCGHPVEERRSLAGLWFT